MLIHERNLVAPIAAQDAAEHLDVGVIAHDCVHIAEDRVSLDYLSLPLRSWLATTTCARTTSSPLRPSCTLGIAP
jgi:hypothetical protein